MSSGFLGNVIGPRWRTEGDGGDGAPPSIWVFEGRCCALGLDGLCVPNEFAAFVDELADLEGDAGLALHELVHGGAFYVEKFFCGEA